MIAETPRSDKYRLSRLARYLHDTCRPTQTAANGPLLKPLYFVQHTLHIRD